MKKLLPYFKSYKKECFLSPLFKLFEAAFELLVPVVVAKIVDVGLGAPLAGGGYDTNTAYIVKMSMLLIGLGLVGLGCAVVAQYFAAKAATGVSYELRRALFAKLQSLSYSDYDEIGTSAMLNRMTGDVQQFQTGINMFLRLFLRSPLIVFGAMIAAFFIDPPSAWVFAAVIPALFLAVALIMGITTPLYRKAQEKSDKVVLAARENLSGVRVVRAFCKEEEECAAFRVKNRALTKGREKAGAIGALMNPVTFVLVNLAVIFLLKIGAIRVDNGSLSQGGVIALYNLMSQILVELVKFANLVVTVTKAAACGERIEGVLEKKSSLKTEDENGEKGKTDKPGYIVFDNATLKYTADAAPALKNVSFGVEKGETIGIIGGTGSGKSSLVSLIPHFYDVSSGGVYLEGKNVAAYDAEELRKKIAVVPQKAVLFKGIENVLLPRVNNSGCYINSVVLQEPADVLCKHHNDIGNNICDNNIVFAADLIGQVTLKYSIFRLCEAIHFAVFPCRLNRKLVDINARCTLCAEQKSGNAEDSASAADIKQFCIGCYVIFKRFKAKACCVVSAAAEGKSGFNIKHRSALRIIIIIPNRANQQLLTDRHRLEIFLPIILPILIAAHAEVYLMLNALRIVTLGKKSNGFGRAFLGRDINMNRRLVSVLFEQILFNQVDMSNLPCRLFKVAVILNINSVGNDHLSNVACRFHVL